MELDLSWILLGLPVAFALGWIASRLDYRQLRIENRQTPKAYFRGLNFLLNEQQDQAIDAFIEAVQNDPDTSELHFALGNLFRRRGEYERAVRVHEHLLSRGDLRTEDRDRAQHALALDFLRAGLLDRAEDSLRKLFGTAFEEQANLALLAIYERSRDWVKAAEIAQRLEGVGQASFGSRRAHYLCEEAVAMSATAAVDGAQALLEQAAALAPNAPRPRVELAALKARRGDANGALDTLAELANSTPSYVPLVATAIREVGSASGRVDEARQILSRNYAQAPSLDVLEALIGLGSVPSDGGSPRDWYLAHLNHEPSLVAASRWLAGETLPEEQAHAAVQKALDHAARPLMRYRCAACGFEAKQHFWQCPGCQAWDSYSARRVEEL